MLYDDWFPLAFTLIFVRRCPLKSFLNFRAHFFRHSKDCWRQSPKVSHHSAQFLLLHLIFNGGSLVMSSTRGQLSFILESFISSCFLEHWLLWPEKQTWIKFERKYLTVPNSQWRLKHFFFGLNFLLDYYKGAEHSLVTVTISIIHFGYLLDKDDATVTKKSTEIHIHAIACFKYRWAYPLVSLGSVRKFQRKSSHSCT